MDKNNQLGLWMDNSAAYLIEFANKTLEIKTILHEFPAEEKNVLPKIQNESLSTLKNYILNKYYSNIGKTILQYKKIILCGPSKTKLDFFDFLSENEQFIKLKIEIRDINLQGLATKNDCITIDSRNINTTH